MPVGCLPNGAAAFVSNSVDFYVIKPVSLMGGDLRVLIHQIGGIKPAMKGPALVCQNGQIKPAPRGRQWDGLNLRSAAENG